MNESLGSIVGYVDTFAYDTADHTCTFSGWVLDELRPTKELDLILLIDGVEYTVDVQRYPRPDLGYPANCYLGYTLIPRRAEPDSRQGFPSG